MMLQEWTYDESPGVCSKGPSVVSEPEGPASVIGPMLYSGLNHLEYTRGYSVAFIKVLPIDVRHHLRFALTRKSKAANARRNHTCNQR